MLLVLIVLTNLSFCSFRLGYDISTIPSITENFIYSDNYNSKIPLNNPRTSRRVVVGYDKYFKNSFGIGMETYIGNAFIDLGLPEEFNSIRYENFSQYLSYRTPKTINIEAFIRYGISNVSMNYPIQETENFTIYEMGSKAGSMYAIGINVSNLQLSFSSYSNRCYVHINDQIESINFEIRKIQASYSFKK